MGFPSFRSSWVFRRPSRPGRRATLSFRNSPPPGSSLLPKGFPVPAKGRFLERVPPSPPSMAAPYLAIVYGHFVLSLPVFFFSIFLGTTVHRQLGHPPTKPKRPSPPQVEPPPDAKNPSFFIFTLLSRKVTSNRGPPWGRKRFLRLIPVIW